MDFEKLSVSEKIAMVELALKIHEVAENKKIPIVYNDFNECVESMVKKAKIITDRIA